MAKSKKPYIICHMMTSVDGRIDCGMTAQLDGNSTYYATLDALDAPTRVSGRVTAATELTDGRFNSQGPALGKTSWKKNATADSYNIVTDTKGTLCKLTVGVASVLLGLSWAAASVSADTGGKTAAT